MAISGPWKELLSSPEGQAMWPQVFRRLKAVVSDAIRLQAGGNKSLISSRALEKMTVCEQPYALLRLSATSSVINLDSRGKQTNGSNPKLADQATDTRQ